MGLRRAGTIVLAFAAGSCALWGETSAGAQAPPALELNKVGSFATPVHVDAAPGFPRLLFVVEKLGPAAASLVPELIATLDKEDVAGNFAAAALGEIGPAAAPAVPALTERLRRGGKWSFRAPMALGGI